MNYERRPPCSIEAEKAVLGAILLDEKSLVFAQSRVDVEDFYVEFFRIIYETMLSMRSASEAIDTLTLMNRLQSKSDKLGNGWQVQLAQLTDGLPRSVNVEHYAGIVKEKAKLRRTIKAAIETTEIAFQGELPACEIAEDLTRSLQSIIGSGGSDFQTSGEVVSRVYAEIEKRSQDRRFVTGIASGFEDLDRMTTGFHESELIIIAARPGVGKTSLAMNIAEHAAIIEKKRVAVFSLEMSNDQLLLRFLAEISGIPLGKVRTGFIDRGDWPKLAAAAGKLAEAPIYFCDSSRLEKLTVPMLSGKSQRLRESKGVDLIIVDYLQLLNDKAENRTQEITKITNGLKRLSGTLNIPVIALSQLNRGIEMNKRKPQLSDLRESGSIEQDADVVIFIHQENKDTPIIPTEFIIGKQRNGPCGTVNVQFNRALTRFESIAQEEQREFGT